MLPRPADTGRGTPEHISGLCAWRHFNHFCINIILKYPIINDHG